MDSKIDFNYTHGAQEMKISKLASPVS